MVDGLVRGRYTRDEVVSWQQAVQAAHGFDIPVAVRDGYWYFFSLSHLNAAGSHGEPLIRDADLAEYLLDMRHVAPPAVPAAGEGVVPLRTFQIDPAEVRWPLTIVSHAASHGLAKSAVPSVRGAFEPRMELVEHSHLALGSTRYLLVRHLDQYPDELMVLGSDRDATALSRLLDWLRD